MLLIVNFPICLPIHVGFMGFYLKGEIADKSLLIVMILYYIGFFSQLIIASETHRKVSNSM